MGGRVNCPNESWGEFSGDTSGLFTRVDGTQLTGSVGTFGWRDFQIEVTPNDLVNAVHKCNAGANVDPSQWYVDWIDRGWEAGGFSDSYLEPVDYMPYETVYSSNNSVLDSGQVLGTGQSMYSPNGRYRLTMQTDGNLVLYDTSNNSPLWGTNCCTLGWTHAYATVQPAGNLVIYADGGAAFGVTNPCGWSSGAYLVLTDDGNLALRNSDGTERWSVAHGGCG
jgi:hypothetical protein